MDSPAESQQSAGCPARLLVIVPAYNEAAVIGKTLKSLGMLARPHDVLVANDGSTDNTVEVARDHGARVLDLACNVGVGGAMQAGYQYADYHGYEVAVQFDADGQHRANQIETIVAPILAGEVAMVVGSRYLGQRRYRSGLDRLVGSRLLAGLVSLLIRRKVTDPTSGFRAVNRRAIRFFSRHYPQAWLGDTVEALVELSRHDFEIKEVPIKMVRRRRGTSTVGFAAGVLHTLRIIIAVLIDCLEKRFDDEPTKGEL